MIALVLRMVWTRRGQAVTLALLSLFAVAAAVAAPAYLIAADRAIAAGQVATASPPERGIVISAEQDDRPNPDVPQELTFTDVAPALVGMPGFSYVFASEIPVVGLEPTNQYATSAVFRLNFCDHVRMVTGRCPIGLGETIVGARTAERLELATGDQITVTFARLGGDSRNPTYQPSGKPATLTIVGTYRVDHPDDAYWGAHDYFFPVPNRPPAEPAFLDAATLASIDHGLTRVSIDGTAGPGALDADNLDGLRAGLAQLQQSSSELGPNIQITSSIPALLERIDAGRAAARVLVPIIAVPLVLLACFSIFLAVGYGTEGRQPELAVVALRGARRWMRWWLATGETLAAVLAGAVAGCLAGQLLVNALAAVRFPGVGVDPSWSSLRYAPLAALAALLAAVLAQRRQLVSPVVLLLRRNPVAAHGWRAIVTEVVVVVFAVLTGVQLVLSHGSLSGVGMLAPALIVMGLALIAARALLPAVTRFAAGALRSGRLGLALAGFQLSRRPGARRLFALLVATVAVAGYAACAVDVAARGRTVESGLGLGADRVITVDTVDRGQLLAAVRGIDPRGQFAMAVSQLPNSSTGEPLGLAVDSSRLAAVATWPGGATPARLVADGLHPVAPDPMLLSGPDIAIEATVSGPVLDQRLRLGVAVSSVTGLGDAAVVLGQLRPGRSVYRKQVPACQDGCRLAGIQLNTGVEVKGVTATVVINSIRPGLPGARLADPAGWRMRSSGKVSAAPAGLRIDLDAPGGLPDGAWVYPADGPDPLPIAYSGGAPADGMITGFDGEQIRYTAVATLPAVPQAGIHAALADLEYADRLTAGTSRAVEPQVWLNAAAPPDVLGRLAARGLVVKSDVRAAQVHRQLDAQGPALAVWFYLLAGGLSVLLGAGALVLAAAVDRGRRIEELATLRVQGLRRASMTRAALWTYPALVLIAGVTGLLTALAGWALTGWALPLAGLNPPDLPLPHWPRLPVLVGTTVAVVALLVLVAAVSGRDLRRRIDRAARR